MRPTKNPALPGFSMLTHMKAVAGVGPLLQVANHFGGRLRSGDGGNEIGNGDTLLTPPTLPFGSLIFAMPPFSTWSMRTMLCIGTKLQTTS